MSADPMTMTIDPCPVLRVEYCMCESQRNASVKPWRTGRSESPYVTMSYRMDEGSPIRRWGETWRVEGETLGWFSAPPPSGPCHVPAYHREAYYSIARLCPPVLASVRMSVRLLVCTLYSVVSIRYSLLSVVCTLHDT